jgi:predicted enzyme related to lactoylglutathione lyase
MCMKMEKKSFEIFSCETNYTVEDMDTAVKYLSSKGVEITWGPVTLGKSKRAEIKDPDGLSIELRQW